MLRLFFQRISHNCRADRIPCTIDRKPRLYPISSLRLFHPRSHPSNRTSTQTILKATTLMAHILPRLFLTRIPVRDIRMVSSKTIKILKMHTTLRSARALQNSPKCSSHRLPAPRQIVPMSTILIGGKLDCGGERY